MDTNIEERLLAIEKKVTENNAILIKMRRVQRNAHLFRLFYWIIIISITAGSLYYIKPYLDQLAEMYSGFQNTQETIKNSIPDVSNINKLLEQIKGL